LRKKTHGKKQAECWGENGRMSDIKILIVEDEQLPALDLQLKLENMGFIVTAITDTGEEAISKTEETHPDLVLMDIMLEGDIDGIETAEQIHQNFNIPVIYISALIDETTMERAKLTEPFAYLFKPFNERELKFIIEIAVFKHKLERELKESELKYRTLFDNIGIPITYLNLDGTILLINTVGARNLGGHPENFVGKSIFEVLPNIADMTRERMHQVVKTGGGCDFEDLIELPSGNHWFYSNFQPMRNASGDIFAIQIVSHDTTKRKQAEQALEEAYDELERRTKEHTAELVEINKKLRHEIEERKQIEKELMSSEERLRIVFEFAPVGYYLSDLKGHFIDGNKAAEKIVGYKKEELIGKNFLKLKLLSPQQIPKAALLLAQNAMGKPTGPDEFILNRKNGTQVEVEISTFPVKIKGQTLVLGIARDISVWKKAEEALRKSEEKYRNLVVNMNHIIFAIDMQGKVTYVNPAVESITGYTPLDVIGREITDFIPQEDLPFVSEKYQKILSGPTEPIEHKILTRSGDIRFASTYGYPIYEEDKIIGIQGIITDTTETKLLQDQIIRSKQLAATGQLAASIAHEINSPLQGIVSLLHSVKNTCKNEKMLLENLDLIESGFRRIRDTVKNLLDLNRPGKEKVQPMNINNIIEETVSLVQSLLRKNKITVNLNLSSKIPDIIASPKQLSHVFLNLINNAVEAMTGVSKSESGKKREFVGGVITINTNFRKKNIIIKVTDTGPGIPKEDLEHIFDLFYTRKKTMGMGVGLSICYGIIQDHNGTIVAKNSPKGGAVFTVTLPTR
jgi:PAS domain S-box-containing protein